MAVNPTQTDYDLVQMKVRNIRVKVDVLNFNFQTRRFIHNLLRGFDAGTNKLTKAKANPFIYKKLALSTEKQKFFCKLHLDNNRLLD